MAKGLELILTTIYALQESSKYRIDYRTLGSYIYLADRILNLGVMKDALLLPGGVESSQFITQLRLLRARGYIEIDRCEISLTEFGKEVVREILINPDRKDLRRAYRLFVELSKEDYTKILSLLSCIYAKEQGFHEYECPEEILVFYNKLCDMVNAENNHERKEVVIPNH